MLLPRCTVRKKRLAYYDLFNKISLASRHEKCYVVRGDMKWRASCKNYARLTGGKARERVI